MGCANDAMRSACECSRFARSVAILFATNRAMQDAKKEDIVLLLPLGTFSRTCGRRYFGNTESVVSINNHDLSPRHQPAIQQNVDWVLHLTVKVDHRSRIEIKDVAQKQTPAAKAQY
jgi:hypothetical protein